MPVKEPAIILVDISLIGAEARRDKGLPEGRRCECCGCALASDHNDKLCRPCDGSIQKWKIFPWLRSQMRLLDHCQKYIDERYGKRAGRDEGGEIPIGGSWARAMGHDKSRKKK